MKFLTILIIALFSSLSFADMVTTNAHIEYREIKDKKQIYRFLFQKHDILLNPDCHRRVFEGRGAKVYVAMGCKIVKLELDKSPAKETMVQVKSTYNCDGEFYPFTSHCELR